MKTIFLGLVVTALVAAASCTTSDATAEAKLTISNEAGMVVSVLVGDKTIKVESTSVMTISLDDLEQDIGIQTADGIVTDVHVRGGDTVVLQPDPVDEHHVLVQVFNATPAKASTSLGQPSLTPAMACP